MLDDWIGRLVITLTGWWAKYRLVVFKLLLDAVAPTSAAAIWGITVAIQKNSTVDGLNAGSLAFFLILSIQNLVQRAAKAVFDKEYGQLLLGRFDVVDQGFDNLQQGFEALRAQGFAPAAPPAELQPPVQRPPAFEPPWVPLSDTQFFASQAGRAIQNDQYLAAVLLAAVGFERAVREVAARLQIADQKQSLGRLIHEITYSTQDKRMGERLATLTRIRNGLVHGEKDGTAINREQAIELINAFQSGAASLTAKLDDRRVALDREIAPRAAW